MTNFSRKDCILSDSPICTESYKINSIFDIIYSGLNNLNRDIYKSLKYKKETKQTYRGKRKFGTNPRKISVTENLVH